jgi:hypothetical protein
MTLSEILSLEGIVIRKIPVEVVSLWTSPPKPEALKPNESIVEKNGRKLLRVVDYPKYGGKYLVTFAYHTNSMIQFDYKTNGIGNTIEEAYADYIAKGESKK